MNDPVERASFGLAAHGLTPGHDVLWNLCAAHLVEHALALGDGQLISTGALAVNTAPHTGRSPKDRFVVREPSSEGDVWWGDVNLPLEESSFAALRALVVARLDSTDLYVQELACGADEGYGISVRVVSESPWHSLFARNMFLAPRGDGTAAPDWTILHAPTVIADPQVHGTRTGTFVVLHFGRREVIIGGTRYAGEVKKAMFSVMNYRLPALDVLPMHCSANVGPAGDVALFFGLSGTGKTTLSTDAARPMIGDDEHGWSERGVFNFEGGSYAKVIRISPDDEPLITAATNRFGTIVENVVVDPVTRRADFDDDTITENTRSSYPLGFLGNIVPSGHAGHAKNVMFLTADAFGILPPIARLTPHQAQYYFLAGYTAKVAGTEGGVKEPQATFSPCFGAPFLPRHPEVYANLLGRRLAEHESAVWLVNTGWTAGPYGQGRRMSIGHTRAMVHAALGGALDTVPTRIDPVFGLAVPTAIPGVPDGVLDPRGTWADAVEYDAGARNLARLFHANFAQYDQAAPDAVRAAGPRTD